MKIKKTLVIICFMLMISQPLMVDAINGMQIDSNHQQLVGMTSPSNNNPISIDTVGGEESLISNVLSNGDLESMDQYNGPENYNYYGSNFQYVNSSYQDEVYSGSYSSYIGTKGTSQYGGSATNSRSMPSSPSYPMLEDILYVNFWYNPKANPDYINGGEIYFYLRIYTGSVNRYIYYYFSRNSGLYANSTNYGYIDMRQGLSSWLHFSRNITADYEEIFTPINPSIELRTIYFGCYSPNLATAFTELLLDDVSITDKDSTEYLTNGDFESGTGSNWQNFATGPSSAFLSSNDIMEGKRALNLTAETYYQGGSANVYCEKPLYVEYNNYPKSFYATQPGDLTFDLDWKYSDTLNGGSSQYSYMYIYGQNSTFSYYLYFYFGTYNDVLPGSNSSGPNYLQNYYAVDGFGMRNIWHHFSIDFYEFFSPLGLLDTALSYVGFQIYAGQNQNSTVQLLLDNMILMAYPTGDPSFEQDFNWFTYDPITAWGGSYDHNFANITSDAHTGNYAGNVTAYNSVGYSSIYRSMYLPLEHNLYTDFWWKINDISSHTNTYSSIFITINNSFNIYYILGASSSTSFLNGSSNVYYYVENFNSTGVWYNLVRDLSKDIEGYFGESNWIITNLYLRCRAVVAGAEVTTIYDDINFARDTTPPEVQSISLLNPPTYYEEAIIDITAFDILNEVGYSEVHYQNSTGWFVTEAIPLNENTLRAFIPFFAYDETINYYVTLFDTKGNSIIDDNSGTYYSYTIIDDVNPLLMVFGPEENTQIMNDITFYIEANDIGSGTESIVISTGDTILYDNETIPTSLILDTKQFRNGNLTISFLLNDNAGNSIEILKVYEVKNIHPILATLDMLFNWGTLTGVGLTGLALGIFFLVRWRIRVKKAS
ncbi:MAG: hypothetical protein ACFFDW_03425 [Candidatus Thorarchaeota archaeon]